ncbi:hypothetical protein [Algoriphagus namhaensis]
MKKLIPIFSLIALFAFQACEGPEGPPGPPGLDGVNIVSETFEVDINFTAENNFRDLFRFEPEILPGDVVLAFIEWELEGGNPIWRAFPQTIFFEEGVLIYNYDFSQSDFSIFLDGPLDYTLLGPEWILNQRFRVVVVPGDFASSRIDWTNYEAVTQLLGIDEEDFVKIKN